ncbi:hypothetical protein D9M68_897360 [compost metagenome]
MIDATEADGRLAVQQDVLCHLYAIYRRTTALVRFYTHFFKQVHFHQAQGIAYGYGMSHTGLRAVRCYYYNLAQVCHCLNKIGQTRCGNTIIIND